MKKSGGRGGGGVKKGRRRVVSFGTDLYGAALQMDQLLFRIDSFEQSINLIGSNRRKDLEAAVKNLLELKSDMLKLFDMVFLLADTETRGKLVALLTERNNRLRLEFESAPAQAAHGKEKSRETKMKSATTVGVAVGLGLQKARAAFFREEARAASEIGDKFKKILLNIHRPVSRSMEVPHASFQLESISSLFDKMWDDARQLQLVSTDAKFLATSMLTDKTLAHHVSILQLCSEDIDWLCTWVPELAERLQRIEKDDEMDDEMMEGAEMEESIFASYIRGWERAEKRNNSMCFEDSTTLSSMMFTHCMPGHHPLFADLTGTMQIFSIKITKLVKDFSLPLEVYGVVAARDDVDHRRNILFLRSRDNCQYLNEEDSLHLTGPSRAIMSKDTLHIEFELKVKGAMKSKDKVLITDFFACNGDGADTPITHIIDGCFCKIELRCQHFKDSIQATVLSACVKKGLLSCANGLEVICYSELKDAEGKAEPIVLFDQKDGAVPVDEEGYLDLSRQVIPVQLNGNLVVVTKTGVMSQRLIFKPKSSNITRESCTLGDLELEIIVAWSVLVDAEQDMLMSSYTKPFMVPSTLPFMKLDGSC